MDARHRSRRLSSINESEFEIPADAREFHPAHHDGIITIAAEPMMDYQI